MNEPNKNTETKTLKVRVYAEAYYDSEIQVPANLDKKAAFEYAKEHIDEIPLTTLNYLPDSDNIDDADLDNNMHAYFDKPADYKTVKPDENTDLIAKIIDRAEELMHTVMTGLESPEIAINEENGMIEIRRYNPEHQAAYKIEDFCDKDKVNIDLLIRELDKHDMYYML